MDKSRGVRGPILGGAVNPPTDPMAQFRAALDEMLKAQWRHAYGFGVVSRKETTDREERVTSIRAAVEALHAAALEGWHMANGVADLAMNHRDAAETAIAASQADAMRYRRFCDAGLPICFEGVEYDDKAALDRAIDTALAHPKETGR